MPSVYRIAWIVLGLCAWLAVFTALVQVATWMQAWPPFAQVVTALPGRAGVRIMLVVLIGGAMASVIAAAILGVRGRLPGTRRIVGDDVAYGFPVTPSQGDVTRGA